MKTIVLKQIEYLRENNEASAALEEMCSLIEEMGNKFLMKEDTLQLLSHFNEAQTKPLHMKKVIKDVRSSIISSRSSLFSKKISYNKDYLNFLIDLTDVHCYEKQYQRRNSSIYLNDRIEELKDAFLVISSDYRKDFTPYSIEESIDFSVYQMMENTLSTILYKTYFEEFWEKEYPLLEKYNSVLTRFLRNNIDYLQDFNEKRKRYYFSSYEYEDVSFELEKLYLLMVWTAMLKRYRLFEGKESILTLVMRRINSDLETLYEMTVNGDYDGVENYIDGILTYCSEKTLRLTIH